MRVRPRDASGSLDELAWADAENPGPGQHGSPDADAASPAELVAIQRDLASAIQVGIRQALAQLNLATRFRFTTLYRVARGQLLGVARVDRENPDVTCAAPVDAPAACYHEAGIAVATAPARSAPRVAGRRRSPAVADVTDVSHEVFALRSASQCVVGVLCHSDPRPRLAREDDRAEAATVALALGRWIAASDDDPRH